MCAKAFSPQELSDHVAIGAILEKNNGDILSMNHKRWNFFTFPVGKAEPGETPEQAMKREMHEELSITVVKFEIIYESTMEYVRQSKPVRVLCVLFKVLEYNGIVRNAEPQNHSEFGYKGIDELAQKIQLSDMLIHYLDLQGVTHASEMQGRLAS